MPDIKKHSIYNFDRDEVLAKIEPLTYDEARRHRGPLYDVLVIELNEAGCLLCACYFQRLVIKEKYLYERGTITERLDVHRPNLLMQIYENVKGAETAGRLRKICTGYVTTFHLLYQTIMLLDPLPKLTWLLEDLYVIFTRICKRTEVTDVGTREWMARIFYRAGDYYGNKGEDIGMLEMSVDSLGNSLELIREFDFSNYDGTNSLTCICETLHETVAKRYSDVLLMLGKLVKVSNPAYAVDLATKAIFAISQLGFQKNRERLCRIQYLFGDFLIKNKEYNKALETFGRIKDDILAKTDTEFQLKSCGLMLMMGIAYGKINKRPEAFRAFSHALELSRIYKSREYEVKVLVESAKFHAMDARSRHQARASFAEAKAIYLQMGDLKTAEIVSYLAAKVRLQQIWPHLNDMMKSGSEHYCRFYNLRQWKNQNKPFWKTLATDLEKQEYTEIYCLKESNYDFQLDDRFNKY